MTSPLKILFVTNMFPVKENPYYGIFVQEQINGLHKNYNIDYEVYFIKGMKGKWHYLISIFKINSLLRKKTFDLIHVHYGISGMFLLLNPFIKTPVIMTLHSGEIDTRKRNYVQIFITKLILSKCTWVIILNNEMREIVRKYNSNMSIIPCGVNTDIFKPSQTSKLDISKTEKLILFPGSRKRIEKNYKFFNEIVQELEHRYSLKLKVQELVGFSREEVAAIFNEVDCVLMTSYSEGSPQVIKEAMACNATIVSTKVGDVDILLKQVKNAIVIDSWDKTEFSDKIYNLLNDTGVKNGRDEIFAQQLDEVSLSKRLYKLYKHILESHRN